ncbi:MAG: glutamyl-tRNA reductase [Frankia sp.]|nr:glutamyl-tRNA reductase [Frankia sp.]
MSVLVVGVSHRTAPVDLLERLSLGVGDIAKTLYEARAGEHVAEAVVLSTCNRVEIYAHVARFHGGVQELTEVLSRRSGVSLDELAAHLYVHYEDRAVHHLFSVASGLESMVVGESEILGQLRSAFAAAQAEGAVGRVLGELCRHALRVGKRARSDTGIGRASASFVASAVGYATDALGSLAGRSALVIGAGTMARLAATTLHDAGVGELVVANRSPDHGAELAQRVAATVVPLAGIATALERVDVVVSCTGAAEVVVPRDVIEPAVERRAGRPLLVVDLAVPRDVDAGAAELPGVTLADLDTLRPALEADSDSAADLEAVRRIVAEEVAVFLGWQRAMRVAPTVVALRAKADELIADELARLRARVPQLDGRDAVEVESTVRRVVDKFLHAPTVRVKELAAAPDGDHYAAALRELFELDPQVPDAVSALESADLATSDEATP